MERLVLAIVQAIYMLVAALFISYSIDLFKKEKYYLFGLDLMWVVFITLKLAETIFVW